jgi:hypothetical protein
MSSSRKLAPQSPTSPDLGDEESQEPFEVKGSAEPSREESRSSTISTKREYRAVSRSTAKNFLVEPNDLYGLLGKWPKNPELGQILTQAHNDRKNPIPKQYAQLKANGTSVGKPILVARILALMPTRKLALQWLKDNDKVDQDAQLEDFYMQVYEDGETFPGDEAESAELKEAFGLPVFETKSSRTTTSNNSRSSFRAEAPAAPAFSPRITKYLGKAIAEDPDRPEKVDKERELLIGDALKMLSTLDNEAVLNFIETFQDQFEQE